MEKHDREEILYVIERFYTASCKQTVQPRNMSDKKAKLTKHYTKDLPDITKTEVKQTMDQMSNNKCPGPDGIVVEMIKVGKKQLIKHITALLYL